MADASTTVQFGVDPVGKREGGVETGLARDVGQDLVNVGPGRAGELKLFAADRRRACRNISWYSA